MDCPECYEACNSKEKINYPKYFYRYQSFDLDRLNVFSEKELYFSSPLSFNDPFDCKLIFDHDVTLGTKSVIDEDILFKNWCRHFREKGCPEGESKSKARSCTDEMLKTHINGESIFAHDKLSETEGSVRGKLKKLGVLCLSEKKDDLLMWAHYADKHDGYCLEFDLGEINKWCEGLKGAFGSVIYKKKYPDINDILACNNNYDELAKLVLLRKSSHWRYENEWRIIVDIDLHEPSPRIRSFQEDMLTGVIFGCAMQESHIEKIKYRLRKWTARPALYKAVKNKRQYALDIVPEGY